MLPHPGRSLGPESPCGRSACAGEVDLHRTQRARRRRLGATRRGSAKGPLPRVSSAV